MLELQLQHNMKIATSNLQRLYDVDIMMLLASVLRRTSNVNFSLSYVMFPMRCVKVVALDPNKRGWGDGWKIQWKIISGRIGINLEGGGGYFDPNMEL